LEIYHFNIKVHLVSYILLLFSFFTTSAQSEFLQISAESDFSASDWNLYSYVLEEDEDYIDKIYGVLRIKWPLRASWDEWRIENNNVIYDIKQKWGNNRDEWELRSETGQIVSIKTKWRNDYTEWVIKSDQHEIRWISEFERDLSSWFFEHKTLGHMSMYTEFRGDPRDWVIEDFSEKISDEIKLAAIFITTYLTNPKN